MSVFSYTLNFAIFILQAFKWYHSTEAGTTPITCTISIKTYWYYYNQYNISSDFVTLKLVGVCTVIRFSAAKALFSLSVNTPTICCWDDSTPLSSSVIRTSYRTNWFTKYNIYNYILSFFPFAISFESFSFLPSLLYELTPFHLSKD